MRKLMALTSVATTGLPAEFQTIEQGSMVLAIRTTATRHTFAWLHRGTPVVLHHVAAEVACKVFSRLWPTTQPPVRALLAAVRGVEEFESTRAAAFVRYTSAPGARLGATRGIVHDKVAGKERDVLIVGWPTADQIGLLIMLLDKSMIFVATAT